MHFRPTFDEIYMDLAIDLSKRSTCSRRHVGCVIVSTDNQRVLAIGYNGSWRGGPNECDSETPGNCGCLHAEENALIKLDYNDHADKKIYTTTMPCIMCAKRIINSGIKQVIYFEEYRNREGVDLLEKAGISVSCSRNV